MSLNQGMKRALPTRYRIRPVGVHDTNVAEPITNATASALTRVGNGIRPWRSLEVTSELPESAG